jgi:hypothetical protein
MRSRAALLSLVLLSLSIIPSPAAAQKGAIDLTAEMLDRWFTGHEKEKAETEHVMPQLTEQNDKIKKFQTCKAAFEAAGEASGKRLGGIAARLAIKAKCGTSDDGAFQKERQRILDGPENAGATAGGFKLADYRNLKEKLIAYQGGDQSGFTKPGLDLLKSRAKQLASVFGGSGAVAGGAGGAAMWGSPDFTWAYIQGVFAMQFLSGATMFETDYKPGEWTRWQASSPNSDDKQVSERAFLGKPADGGEWWRMKTIFNSGSSADTITLEAWFKPEPGNEMSQKLVRMRGRLPGSTEPQEMVVPEQYSTWNMAGSMGRRPTKESIDGATVGTESVTTPAGSFRAKHVRFGGGMGGGGTIDWWLDESAVGGWVKFASFDGDKKPTYTMELIAKGTGAKSELGVTIK